MNSSVGAVSHVQPANLDFSWVDQLFQSSVNIAILWVLVLATLFQVLEMAGFLPAWASNWINRNRLRETMRLLREFGVDVDTPKRANQAARLEQIAGDNLTERVQKRLATTKIEHKVVVGSQVAVKGEHYFDLMGATADLSLARVFARDLSALWRNLTGVGGAIANSDFDFVVTPKSGSPLLGACFAELLKKPLLLHNPDHKFRSDPTNPRAMFDFAELPALGSKGLMVDDSSTGGGKALRLIDDLRACGWEVSDFLVVFEPQLKVKTRDNAAARLAPKGVTLHSIVTT